MNSGVQNYSDYIHTWNHSTNSGVLNYSMKPFLLPWNPSYWLHISQRWKRLWRTQSSHSFRSSYVKKYHVCSWDVFWETLIPLLDPCERWMCPPRWSYVVSLFVTGFQLPRSIKVTCCCHLFRYYILLSSSQTVCYCQDGQTTLNPNLKSYTL